MTVRRVATMAFSSLCILCTSAEMASPTPPGQTTSERASPSSTTTIAPTNELAAAQLRDRSPTALKQRHRALIEIANPGSSTDKRSDRPKIARISLSLKDADLVEVLRSFARIADVNLVLAPGIEGKVNLELHDVPWDQALAVILKSHRLGAELDGGIWRVGS